jgi:hypothetical protein
MSEEFAPIDKGKLTDTVLELLDLINKHYGENAEILDAIAIARVKADNGDEYIDFILSEDTTVGEARHMLEFARDHVEADPNE